MIVAFFSLGRIEKIAIIVYIFQIEFVTKLLYSMYLISSYHSSTMKPFLTIVFVKVILVKNIVSNYSIDHWFECIFSEALIFNHCLNFVLNYDSFVFSFLFFILGHFCISFIHIRL